MKDHDKNCPVTLAMQVLGGKWKILILYHLCGGTLRFSELREAIPRITGRMLTMQLRDLEAAKLVQRRVYAEVPPRVEYSLTELGRMLEPVLDSMSMWGENYQRRAGYIDVAAEIEAQKKKKMQ